MQTRNDRAHSLHLCNCSICSEGFSPRGCSHSSFRAYPVRTLPQHTVIYQRNYTSYQLNATYDDHLVHLESRTDQLSTPSTDTILFSAARLEVAI
jgi:hypothetical protein